MKRIGEISRISGVSVRTLRYYDTIGLLRPALVTKAGYRLYDEAALDRLQQILLLRELEFSLTDVQTLLNSPAYERSDLLDRQITLLSKKRDHTERLIALAKEMRKGTDTMNFTPFNDNESEQMKQEILERYGQTEAYREYRQRHPTDKSLPSSKELMNCFAAFGKLSRLSPDCREVKEAVKGLQQTITEHYYTCTNEILASLGEMYENDPRFTETIDAAGGTGTARFVAESIRRYVE